MSRLSNSEVWLTAAECADRAGLTVRALRIYEQRGLIKPPRSSQNWRLYGAAELSRLTEIQALKRLGLSLARITDLLAGRAVDLDRTLAMQQSALREQQAGIDRSLALIQKLRARLAAGKSVSIDQLVQLIRETAMNETASDAIAWRRYEQAKPRTAIQIAPDMLDDYAGSYQLNSAIISVCREGDRLLLKVAGQQSVDLFPEETDCFFIKIVPAQLTFHRNGQGLITGMTLHQNGLDRLCPRMDDESAQNARDALSDRIKRKAPLPHSENTLRRVILESQSGEVDFGRMTDELASAVREQLPTVRSDLAERGAIMAISFKGVSENGMDVYDVAFDRGLLEWRLSLNDADVIDGLYFRTLP